VPEREWTLEDVAERVKWGVAQGKRSMMLIVAEGAVDSLKSDVRALVAAHPQLSSINPDRLTSSQLAEIIEVLSGHETRATVLGYIQRGGSPSARDRALASRFGAYATQLLRDNIGGVAVGIRGERMIHVPFADVQKGVKLGFDADSAADGAPQYTISELVDVLATSKK
jgi:6-phosphofructokinase 1